MDFKENLKKNLKQRTEEIELNTSSSDFFSQISKELQKETESNPVLKFKKNLSESLTQVKTKNKDSILSLFEDLTMEETVHATQIIEEALQIQEEYPIIQETIIDIIQEKDLISLAADSISKEESIKSVSENTNLFSQPDSERPNKDIKIIQNKVKFLEDWITKISMAGPGSGEVNFRWLDDVDRSTIGNTDQILRFNPANNKFFFGQLSGDQGPIRSLEFDNSGAGIANPNPGTLEWNTDKDCLNVYQNDNSVLQVGLENYIRVHNGTAGTLDNGTLVQFSGVNGDSETPICIPLLANSSFVSLYTIGVLTNDIPSGQNGRATILGEVHDLNTTGSSVGETWSVGDLLWASPTNAGKLTNVQPTAPNPVISIAAVLNVSNTSGILLVRPVIFPRLYYGSFYDTNDQTANTINVPQKVRLGNTQISSGFHIANNTQVVAENAGLYNYQFSIQVDSTTASSGQNIWIWYRKNGQDVPHSASRISVQKDYLVPSWNFIESMEIGHYFELMWATDSSSVKLDAPPPSAFCPAIPSVILTVTQVNL